jgi:hypothetical protein
LARLIVHSIGLGEFGGPIRSIYYRPGELSSLCEGQNRSEALSTSPYKSPNRHRSTGVRETRRIRSCWVYATLFVEGSRTVLKAGLARNVGGSRDLKAPEGAELTL